MPTVVKPTRRAPAEPAPPRPAARPAKRRPAKAAPPPAKEALVGWGDLTGKGAPAPRKRERRLGLVDTVPTPRFALLLIALCAALTLYVGHLYSTQALVEEVQALRKEKLRLVLQQNRLRGEFDRMTAPAVILQRADALGLHPSADYGPTILMTD
jgi:hypothetical protein